MLLVFGLWIDLGFEYGIFFFFGYLVIGFVDFYLDSSLWKVDFMDGVFCF